MILYYLLIVQLWLCVSQEENGDIFLVSACELVYTLFFACLGKICRTIDDIFPSIHSSVLVICVKKKMDGLLSGFSLVYSFIHYFELYW